MMQKSSGIKHFVHVNLSNVSRKCFKTINFPRKPYNIFCYRLDKNGGDKWNWGIMGKKNSATAGNTLRA